MRKFRVRIVTCVLTVVRFGIDCYLGRSDGHMAGLDSGASALVLATVVRPHPRYHEHGSFPETRFCHRDVIVKR